MKLLALSINGQQIQVPSYINSFTSGNNWVGFLLSNFIAFLFFIVILLALLYMIYSGFQWMTSGGDQEKIKKAKQSITYTLVGVVLAFFAFLLISLIGTFFNVPLVTVK